MMGGISGRRFLSDLWPFIGTAWVQVSPGLLQPNGRNLHALAYHAGSGKVVMAGGSLGVDNHGNPLNESQTWIWDGNLGLWNSPPNPLPSPRMGTHLVEYGNNVLIFARIFRTGLPHGT